MQNMGSSLEYETRISSGPQRSFIAGLIERHRIEHIVETGSYDGLGSSSLLASTGLPFDTIECHAMNFVAAKVNLSSHVNATVHHAYSLPLSEMLGFIESDEWTNDPGTMEDLGVKFDHEDPKWYYRHELIDVVTMPRREGLLMELIDNDRRQLVFLDSSGGVGLMEFRAFMSIGPERLRKKVLMLDDVDHIKHRRSVQELQEMGIPLEWSNDRRLVAACMDAIRDT